MKRQSSISYITTNRMSGFTLLEVLLAIGITAMIGLGSWQILTSAIRASESTQLRLSELNALQKAMLIVSRDMRQVLPRSIRDEYGDYQPAMTTKNELSVLEFTRTGWRNPMDDKRSNIQRVAYELSDNSFIRHYWNVLDRSQDSTPISKTLLTDIESISLRFMNEGGGWLDEWPSSTAGDSPSASGDPRLTDNQLPKAIEISFVSEKFGKFKRLYDLVAYLDSQDMPQENISKGE
ncbi:MAG: type II secretion system minor pseudopilin GspJ [Oleiphilus sp.]